MMKHVLVLILAMVAGSTLAQFIRLARWPYRLAFWFTLLFACCALSGCASSRPLVHVMPFTVVNGGVNLDGIHEACNAKIEGNVTILEACDVR